MNTSHDQWFVEQFHLRSPVEEFQAHCRLEIERLRDSSAKFDDALHRDAVELVLRKLRPERTGGGR